MKFPSLFRHGLLLAGLALALPAAHAADAPDAANSPPPRFSLEIRNSDIIENGKPAGSATIGNILDYLKKKNVEVTLALGPGVANVVVGDMVLHLDLFDPHQLDPQALCRAIVTSATQQLDVQQRDSVFSLFLVNEQRQVAVFNLTSYLDPDGKADDKTIQSKLASVTDIIFKTLKDMDPTFSDATQPHYQFHQGANLLVVTGDEQDITVAGQVINALNPPPPSWSGPTYGATPTPIAGFPPGYQTQVVPGVPQVIPNLPGTINVGPGGQHAVDLPMSAMNLQQLQAVMNAFRQSQAQSPLTPEQIKQFQQHLDELSQMMQNFDRQMQGPSNNNPVIIQDVPGTGGSSGSP